MLLRELMGDFLRDETERLPVFLPDLAIDRTTDSRFSDWETVDSPNRLIKDFTAANRNSVYHFVSGLLQFEDAYGHNAKIIIESLNVRIEVYTHDVDDVTELDIEYAQYADGLWMDMVSEQ